MKGYSALQTSGGRTKTYYYAAGERVERGPRRQPQAQAEALDWDVDVDEDLREAWVRPYKVRRVDQKIFDFKGMVIKDWTSIYEVSLPEPYFRLAYDAGFGAKNAQGFGMVGVVNGGDQRGGKGA